MSRPALLIAALALSCSACGVEIRSYPREGLSIHHLVVGVGNVWALESADGFALVDLSEKGDADEILLGLEQLGKRPADVGLVIVTHGHMDHAGPGKRMQQEGMGPLALGAADLSFVEDGLSPPPKSTGWEGEVARLVLDPSFPAWTPDLLFGDGPVSLAPYGFAGRVLPMPGHSAGSVVVVLDTGDAFVGDLIRGDAPLVGGKGDHQGEAVTHVFSADERADRSHLDDVLALGVDTIFPGHGPFFDAASLRGWLADRAFELGDLD